MKNGTSSFENKKQYQYICTCCTATYLTWDATLWTIRTKCQRTNSITDLRSYLIGHADYIHTSNVGEYRSPFYSQFTVRREAGQAAQKLLHNFLSLKFAVFYAISIYKRLPKAAIIHIYNTRICVCKYLNNFFANNFGFGVLR